ncbi:hypothetical protein [uncultured Roseobacter sp.]|uniref:hypothetical protein n=1 Tax=uncultured Roseobacter sp. TaxID=114847 RepID=UPI00261AAD9F|nr:hypothetical protein [uncultured Roseobacter sp.]
MVTADGKAGRKDNFSDVRLFEVAKSTYQTEFSLSQHYETLRASLTAVNLALVGAVFSIDVRDETARLAFLLILGLVSALLALRLGQAHQFHFKLAAKMRRIALQHHRKAFSKFNEVNRDWSERNFWWSWADHEALWVFDQHQCPVDFCGN